MKRLARFVSAILFLLGAAMPAAFAKGAYELTVVPPSATGNPTYFRIDVATGTVDYVNGTQFSGTTEATPIPQGDYHLYTTATADLKSYWLYRMDSQTGRTWFLSGGKWTEIAPAK